MENNISDDRLNEIAEEIQDNSYLNHPAETHDELIEIERQHRESAHIARDLNRQLGYKPKDIPKWISEMKPDKGEIPIQRSEVFWEIYFEDFFMQPRIRYSYRQTQDLILDSLNGREVIRLRDEGELSGKIMERVWPIYDEMGIPDNRNLYPFLVRPDVRLLSRIHGVTPDQIRKFIQRWCKDSGPVRFLMFDRPRNEGGKAIYVIGYWTKGYRGYRSGGRKTFLTQKRFEGWMRRVKFRS